jgi:predicted AAA+ superfamily ATPase
MENVIFNELLARGYSVDVGVVETVSTDKSGKSVRRQYEVDFVVNDSDRRFYIQSALAIPDEDKLRQETNSFRNIHDSFKRILIVKEDNIPYNNEEGILIMGLYDFLLYPELLK